MTYTSISCDCWTREILPGCHDKLRALKHHTNAVPWNAGINNQCGYFAPGNVIIGEVTEDSVVFYRRDPSFSQAWLDWTAEDVSKLVVRTRTRGTNDEQATR